ncbi:MAG: ATP synthase F1 subunit delta [Deltaproteobacteria bacterium]|nr:ATP synthase F1 subunit delta [Deltaproteobacteria bacterium]
MSLEKLSKRYARALFELGTEEKCLERFQDELHRLQDVFTSEPIFLKFFSLRQVDLKKKEKILEEVLQKLAISSATKNFLFLLLKRRRMPFFADIVKIFDFFVKKSQNIVVAQVAVADQKSFQSFQAPFKNSLEKMLAKKVEIQLEEKPSLIGGFTVRVGDKIFDASLSGALDQMEENLSLRA